MKHVPLLVGSKGFMILFILIMLLIWALFGCADDFSGGNVSLITLDSIAPKTAYTGETFRIYGKGFAAVPDSNRVYINDIEAIVQTPASLSTLIVSIPDDAISGNVILKAWGEKASGPVLTILDRPLIQEVSEVSYQQLIITGKYFPADPSQLKVYFNGNAVTIANATQLAGERVQLTAPFIKSTDDNPVSIIVASDGVNSRPFAYAVTPILKGISQYTETDDPIAYISFAGAYFGFDADGNDIVIKENGKIITPKISIESWSTAQIHAAIELTRRHNYSMQVKIGDKLSDPIAFLF